MEQTKTAVKTYRDLVVWQKGIELAKLIYQISEQFPVREQFGLTSQIRRAAVSVPSNIAEGQARQHTGEFVQFLHIALGSLAEIDTQMVLAKELNFTDQTQVDTVTNQITELRKMLYSLINHLPNRSKPTKCSGQW